MADAVKTKLTEAQIQAVLGTAKAKRERPVHCPWNPFPHDSPWGRLVDEAYRQKRFAGHLRAREPRQ